MREIEENDIQLKNQLELKDKQIKNLQIKLDSQDLIINDYYSLKDKYSLQKNEILNLKKTIENLNSNKSSLEFEIKRGKVEKENLLSNINELKNQLKDIKVKTNSLFNNQNKMESEINDYKKRELMLGTVQIENQTLNTKISTLNDIDKMKNKTIYELKDINSKLNTENNNLIQENNEYKKKLEINTNNYKDLEKTYNKEKQKTKELLEINRILIEEKKKLTHENSNLNQELKNLKKNYDIISAQNKKNLEEFNNISHILS